MWILENGRYHAFTSPHKGSTLSTSVSYAKFIVFRRTYPDWGLRLVFGKHIVYLSSWFISNGSVQCLGDSDFLASEQSSFGCSVPKLSRWYRLTSHITKTGNRLWPVMLVWTSWFVVGIFLHWQGSTSTSVHHTAYHALWKVNQYVDRLYSILVDPNSFCVILGGGFQGNNYR